METLKNFGVGLAAIGTVIGGLLGVILIHQTYPQVTNGAVIVLVVAIIIALCISVGKGIRDSFGPRY